MHRRSFFESFLRLRTNVQARFKEQHDTEAALKQRLTIVESGFGRSKDGSIGRPQRRA
jgi:hypothetical protein